MKKSGQAVQPLSSFVRPPPFNDNSFPKPTMASADFPPNGGASPGKSIFLPPIPAESIPIIVFMDFVSQNLTKLKSGPHILFLFVSTGVCSLASFTAYLAVNQLATY
jgi:hypothetical protein